jgi:hypothetical protein
MSVGWKEKGGELGEFQGEWRKPQMRASKLVGFARTSFPLYQLQLSHALAPTDSQL